MSTFIIIWLHRLKLNDNDPISHNQTDQDLNCNQKVSGLSRITVNNFFEKKIKCVDPNKLF